MTITEPTINDQGDEEHPSFGVVRVNRVSAGAPGIRLFDSSLPHHQFVTLEIAGAVRHRDLNHDTIFGNHRPKIAVEMTLSQWGALVSSFGQGAGTPVTITRVDNIAVPQAAHESRLAVTSREVADAATKATEVVRKAIADVEAAFERKAGRREMAELIHNLHHAGQNSPSNMKYAADTLTRHAEDVVSKAKADIEAAQQFGNTIVSGAQPLELEA